MPCRESWGIYMSCASLCLFTLLLGNCCVHLANVSLGRSPLRLSDSHETVLGRVVIAMRRILIPCGMCRLVGIISKVSRHGRVSYKPSAPPTPFDFKFLCWPGVHTLAEQEPRLRRSNHDINLRICPEWALLQGSPSQPSLRSPPRGRHQFCNLRYLWLHGGEE